MGEARAKKAGDPAEGKRLLTTAQVAALLAIDKRTVYRLASAGKLRAIKIGRATRYRPEEVERIRDRGTRLPARA